MILPKACYGWMYLHLQDFKSISEYNSILFKISSKLQLFGEKVTNEGKLKTTFSTFRTLNVFM